MRKLYQQKRKGFLCTPIFGTADYANVQIVQGATLFFFKATSITSQLLPKSLFSSPDELVWN